MNQASDMLVIQSLAFFGKKLLFLEKKNFKNDNFLNGIKTKQDKIKNSNIVEKIWFGSINDFTTKFSTRQFDEKLFDILDSCYKFSSQDNFLYFSSQKDRFRLCKQIYRRNSNLLYVYA